MEHLSSLHLLKLRREAEKEPFTWQRRRTLLAVADLALESKAHDTASRARMRRFRQGLLVDSNNDEIEVVSETLMEALFHASCARVTGR